MRKHGGTPSWRDQHVTPAAISPPGVARGRFVGGKQSGLAGCMPPPLFKRGPSSCSSQGQRQGEPWGASSRPSAPTYLPGPCCGVLCHLVRRFAVLPCAVCAVLCVFCHCVVVCGVFRCCPLCCWRPVVLRCVRGYLRAFSKTEKTVAHFQ